MLATGPRVSLSLGDFMNFWLVSSARFVAPSGWLCATSRRATRKPVPAEGGGESQAPGTTVNLGLGRSCPKDTVSTDVNIPLD